ncbi:unnamed protein product [Nezara viridula]|uniref:Neuropeptide n=1 Tax=Nezara viridula TaxID=85310 RepID=A0A9P0HTC6_NEZVI|nr:unnamed protein product [Nezara viridula]
MLSPVTFLIASTWWLCSLVAEGTGVPEYQCTSVYNTSVLLGYHPTPAHYRGALPQLILIINSCNTSTSGTSIIAAESCCFYLGLPKAEEVAHQTPPFPIAIILKKYNNPSPPPSPPGYNCFYSQPTKKCLNYPSPMNAGPHNEPWGNPLSDSESKDLSQKRGSQPLWTITVYLPTPNPSSSYSLPVFVQDNWKAPPIFSCSDGTSNSLKGSAITGNDTGRIGVRRRGA